MGGYEFALSLEVCILVFVSLLRLEIRMKTRFILFCFFASILCWEQITAQIVPFRNYTIRDGLPQNSVMSLMQDSKGYMWFATQVGVARFDGKNFANFSIAQGMSGNNVDDILEDGHGRMWFATKDGGVSMWNGHSFVHYTKKEGLTSNEVKSLFLDHSGRIWCVTAAGLSVIDKGKIKTVNHSSGLAHDNVLSIFGDSKGRVWVGTQGGITLFNGDNVTNIVQEVSYSVKGKPGNTKECIIWAFTEDKKGNIWIGTQGGGVFVTDGRKYRNYTTVDGLASDYVLSLFTNPSGQIWMGHYGNGITEYNGHGFIVHANGLLKDEYVLGITSDKRGNLWCRTLRSGVLTGRDNNFRLLGKANNLVDDQVQDIFTDHTGNVWIGTLGGVSLFGKDIFEIYNTATGLPDNNIVSVACTKNESVWLGTYNELVRLKNGIPVVYKHQKNLIENVVLSLFEDHTNTLWIGSYGALVRRTDNAMTKVYNPELYHEDNGIYKISEGRQGNLWLATESGAYSYNRQSFRKYDIASGLVSGNVKGVLQDSTGNIWFATAEGVTVLHHQHCISFTTSNGLPSNTCTEIASDGKHHVWIGTEAGVVDFVLQKDTFLLAKIFNRRDGLASNTVYSLMYDRKGNLWIGHEKGLNRLHVKTGKIFYYGSLDGFIPMENNQNAVSMDTHGHIWFGTVSGLVEYIPENDYVLTDPPYTYITSIRFPGKAPGSSDYGTSMDSITGLPVNLKLPYNRNTLIFDFIGIHYTVPEKVKYQFKLEGYDDQWSDPSSLNYAEYKKIPNGHYRFLVKACNSDGIWNPQPVSFSFQVQPPFWKTLWFICLVILAGLGVVVMIIKYRERKLQHDKRVLEQKVVERTAEIARQKEEIERKNDALQEQQLEILAQRDEIERQRDVATQQRDQIALQKQEITDSIHYASRIQSAILPSDDFTEEVLPDHFILFKPRDIVSGDFYWMTRRDHLVVVVAADCTGHGVPGAFMSMLGVSLLNEIVNKEDTFQANLILNNLRENVKITLSQTGKEAEAKDGMDISLCVINTETNILQFAGANNPLYLVRNEELIEYKGDNMPIGIHAGEERSFSSKEVQIQPGDSFYIFSDGYTDQFGGPGGGKFKTKPFKRLFAGMSKKPMSEQKQILEETLEQWRGNLDQVDDILVIGFTIH